MSRKNKFSIVSSAISVFIILVFSLSTIAQSIKSGFQTKSFELGEKLQTLYLRDSKIIQFNGKECVAALSDESYSIKIFEVESTELIKEYFLPKELMNKNDYLTSWYIDDKEIVMMFSKHIYRIQMLNDKLNLSDIYKINTNPKIDPMVVHAEIYFPIRKYKDGFISMTYPWKIPFNEKSFYDYNVASEISLLPNRKKEIRPLSVTYPNNYKQSFYGFMQFPIACYNSRTQELVYGFMASDSIYSLSLSNSDQYKKACSSKFQLKPTDTLDRDSLNNPNLLVKHLSTQPSYGIILYDSVRNLYYRMFTNGRKVNEYSNSKHPETIRDMAIIVMDSSLNIKKEIYFPQFPYSNFAASICKEGLAFVNYDAQYDSLYRHKLIYDVLPIDEYLEQNQPIAPQEVKLVEAGNNSFLLIDELITNTNKIVGAYLYSHEGGLIYSTFLRKNEFNVSGVKPGKYQITLRSENDIYSSTVEIE